MEKNTTCVSIILSLGLSTQQIVHILKSLNKFKNPVIKVSLSVGYTLISKIAFNTVNHNVLQTKLEHYGIKDKANYWLYSFSTDRKQYASAKRNYFKFQENIHGVPQKFALGSLLFIIFINLLNAKVAVK